MEYDSWEFPWQTKERRTSRNHSSVFSDFDQLCNQTGSTTVGFSRDWRNCPEMEQIRNWLKEKILQIPNPVWQDRMCVSSVEIFLWTVAPSKEEYMNLETLTRRVQAVLGESNAQAHVSANYSMPKGGQSGPSTVHDLPCFPEDRSSIPPVANMDMRSNLPVYGGGSYLDANTRCISNYFPHQHTNNCDTDIQQHTKGKKMIYGFSNHFPGWNSCLESQDTWKCQPQMLDFQMNSTVRHDVNDVLSGNTEPIPVLDSYSGLNNDQWNDQLIQPYSSQTPSEVQQQSQFPPLSSINFESNGEELTNPMFHSTEIGGINNNEAVDTFEKILEEPRLESPDVVENNFEEFVASRKSRKRTLDMDPFATGGEVKQGIAELDSGFALNSSFPTLTEDVFPIDGEHI